MEECKHSAYMLKDGNLVCASCGAPSPSERWRKNVFGHNAPEAKAVDQTEVENKGRFWPSESKRGPGRPRKNP